MRYQGKIYDWKDDQGFGFVRPNGGGQKAFVHIKAFSTKSKRPTNGDLISYELDYDEKGRSFAKIIKYVNELEQARSPKYADKLSSIFAITFCILLLVYCLVGRIPQQILTLYFGSSALALITYAIDKSAAKGNRWRTQESTLHLLSLIGGWPGALFAQKLLRHKTKKEEFQVIFWITVIANCSILGWLLLTQNGTALIDYLLN